MSKIGTDIQKTIGNAIKNVEIKVGEDNESTVSDGTSVAGYYYNDDLLGNNRSQMTSLHNTALKATDNVVGAFKNTTNDLMGQMLSMSVSDFSAKGLGNRMTVFMNRLMSINVNENATTLGMIGKDAMNGGDDDSITTQALNPSYVNGRNYLDFVKQVKASEVSGTDSTRRSNDSGSYVKYDNLYPDENNSGTFSNKWNLSGNQNSILYKTKRLFEQKKINTIISKFGTETGTINYNGSSKTKSYGESRGRNLLKAGGDTSQYNINGYNNPYCRVWTHHYQYDSYNKTIRPFSIDDDTLKGETTKGVVEFSDWGEAFNDSSLAKKYDVSGWRIGDSRMNKSVLNTEGKGDGLVKITPKYISGGYTNNHTKECMFSIENLAWKGYDPYSFEKALSWEQRGPLGGRIMWFPPYGITFNENTNVQWSENSFIGRGEDVYTYVNTRRQGTLSFLMVVDHPSIIDYANWYEKPANTDLSSEDDMVNRFFAGCDPLDPKNENSLLSKVKPTPLTDEYIEEEPAATPAATPQTPAVAQGETATEESLPEEIAFAVFYPHNYSGYYDNNNQNDKLVDPIAYLLFGVSACKTWSKKQGGNSYMVNNSEYFGDVQCNWQDIPESIYVGKQTDENMDFICGYEMGKCGISGYDPEGHKDKANKMISQIRKNNNYIKAPDNAIVTNFAAEKYQPFVGLFDENGNGILEKHRFYYRTDGRYPDKTKNEKFSYDCDTDNCYKVKNTYGQWRGEDDIQYVRDLFSYNLNSIPYNGDWSGHKDGEFYSLLEVAYALYQANKINNIGTKVKERLDQLYKYGVEGKLYAGGRDGNDLARKLDGERINKLIDLFKNRTLTKINSQGFSNSHGQNSVKTVNESRNDFLAEQRAWTPVKWLASLNAEWAEKFNGNVNPNVTIASSMKEDSAEGTPNYPTPKLYRSAIVTLEFATDDVTSTNETNQRNECKFTSIISKVKDYVKCYEVLDGYDVQGCDDVTETGDNNYTLKFKNKEGEVIEIVATFEGDNIKSVSFDGEIIEGCCNVSTDRIKEMANSVIKDDYGNIEITKITTMDTHSCEEGKSIPIKTFNLTDDNTVECYSFAFECEYKATNMSGEAVARLLCLKKDWTPIYVWLYNNDAENYINNTYMIKLDDTENDEELGDVSDGTDNNVSADELKTEIISFVTENFSESGYKLEGTCDIQENSINMNGQANTDEASRNNHSYNFTLEQQKAGQTDVVTYTGNINVVDGEISQIVLKSGDTTITWTNYNLTIGKLIKKLITTEPDITESYTYKESDIKKITNWNKGETYKDDDGVDATYYSFVLVTNINNTGKCVMKGGNLIMVSIATKVTKVIDGKKTDAWKTYVWGGILDDVTTKLAAEVRDYVKNTENDSDGEKYYGTGVIKDFKQDVKQGVSVKGRYTFTIDGYTGYCQFNQIDGKLSIVSIEGILWIDGFKKSIIDLIKKFEYKTYSGNGKKYSGKGVITKVTENNKNSSGYSFVIDGHQGVATLYEESFAIKIVSITIDGTPRVWENKADKRDDDVLKKSLITFITKKKSKTSPQKTYSEKATFSDIKDWTVAGAYGENGIAYTFTLDEKDGSCTFEKSAENAFYNVKYAEIIDCFDDGVTYIWTYEDDEETTEKLKSNLVDYISSKPCNPPSQNTSVKGKAYETAKVDNIIIWEKDPDNGLTYFFTIDKYETCRCDFTENCDVSSVNIPNFLEESGQKFDGCWENVPEKSLDPASSNTTQVQDNTNIKGRVANNSNGRLNYDNYTEDNRGGYNRIRYDQEYYFFRALEKKDKFVYDKLMDKLKYFDPAFHSMTPEGFNARLTFLNQCTRQGNTVSASDGHNSKTANNLAFGRPPFCVLRLGDFYNQMIVINNIQIDYSVSDGIQWDMNTEGIGMQPLLARVNISFNFIGGGDIAGPVRRLQNAMSFNYYANTGFYDNRADRVTYKSDENEKTVGGAGNDYIMTDNSYSYITQDYKGKVK